MRLLLLIALFGLATVAMAIPISTEDEGQSISLLDVADAGDLHSNDADRLARYYGGWGGGGWGGGWRGGWGGRWGGGYGGWGRRGWGGWGGRGWGGGWGGYGWGGRGWGGGYWG